MANQDGTPKRPHQGRRGTITTRPSRDAIVRSYAEKDASRARNARLHSQEATLHYQESSFRAKERASQREMLEAMRKEEEERRAAEREYQRDREAANARSKASMHNRQSAVSHRPSRVVEPLTSQQSQERILVSRQAHERERENRDVLSTTRAPRTSNRELIDARGSVDSRAFNEHNELVGYSIDETDRPRPAIDASNPKAKWHSHAGQGFANSRSSLNGRLNRSLRSNLESLSDTISGKSSYSNRQGVWNSLPPLIKVMIPLIVILFAVLIFILFF